MNLAVIAFSGINFPFILNLPSLRQFAWSTDSKENVGGTELTLDQPFNSPLAIDLSVKTGLRRVSSSRISTISSELWSLKEV